MQDEDDGAQVMTQKEGFKPLEAAPMQTLVEDDSGPREESTAPSDAHAKPLAPPLPAYLTPPYLIGGAVILLLLGVLLGKLL